MSLQKIRTSRLYHLPRYSIKQTPGKLVLLIVTNNMTVLIFKDVGVKSTICHKKHLTKLMKLDTFWKLLFATTGHSHRVVIGCCARSNLICVPNWCYMHWICTTLNLSHFVVDTTPKSIFMSRAEMGSALYNPNGIAFLIFPKDSCVLTVSERYFSHFL